MSALRCKRGGWQGPWGGLGIPGTHCPPPTAWLELDPKALHWMHPRLRAEEGWWDVVCTQPREGGTAGQAETTHCAASELSRAVQNQGPKTRGTGEQDLQTNALQRWPHPSSQSLGEYYPRAQEGKVANGIGTANSER